MIGTTDARTYEDSVSDGKHKISSHGSGSYLEDHNQRNKEFIQYMQNRKQSCKQSNISKYLS
jgi:hypothetical protein